MDKLPKVLTTSVIRSSNKGESHGGLYLVDLESSELTQIIDWNKIDINWEGRGMDRGMRGIAFYKRDIYAAISDEILVYNKNFNQIDGIKNRYLKHCHEIFIDNEKLFLTSTGFDSILEYDLERKEFTCGYCFRFTPIYEYLNKFNIRTKFYSNIMRFLPKLTKFDPNNGYGPAMGDTLHINNVFVKNGAIYISGRWVGVMMKISNNNITLFSFLPYLTHNAMPYKDGVIANNTEKKKISILNGNNEEIEKFGIPYFDKKKLHNGSLPDKYAQQGFARGLCVYNDFIIAGSSPATISVYRRGNYDPIKTVNISMDIRNAIHGLEVWDF